MNDKMLDNMRKETTKQAIKTIKSHSELRRVFEAIAQSGSAEELQNECTEWANTHNGEFGDIFVDELPLVYWDKVLKSSI